jgi:hypothetical protein
MSVHMPPPQTLAIQAWFWRQRSLQELRILARGLQVHRNDILRMQEKLTCRVTGIEQAMYYLDQAVAALNTTTDAAFKDSQRRLGRKPGSGRKIRRVTAPPSSEAAE